MKVHEVKAKNIQGNIRKDNNRYIVKDNDYLEDLVLSSTKLYAFENTLGHSHDNDEIYFFIEGTGDIKIGDVTVSASPGDIYLIPKNDFHQVINTTDEILYFLTVFPSMHLTYGQQNK